ncbi:MAG: ribonuclease P protein component [Actinomycetia bacterium]|nr:ribonuclease P protein component [Actinomycetes bacterium]
MLPARHRLRTGADFRAVTRGRGSARSGSPLLVLHANQTDSSAARPPRVGFVVSKALGGAVVRNRVRRQLRAIVAPLLPAVPGGVDLVVRAQPAAADATFAALRADLEHALTRVVARMPSIAAAGAVPDGRR